MKILHVVSYYPPGRIGGVGEAAAQLHRGLRRRGHPSRVLTTGTSDSDPEVTRFATTPISFLCGLPKFAGLTKDYDVVHCHQGDALGLILAMRVRRISTPVLVTYHVGHRGMAQATKSYTLSGHRFSSGWKGFGYRQVIARFHRLTDWSVFQLADAACFVARSSAIDLIGPRRAEDAEVIYCSMPKSDETRRPPARSSRELLFVGVPSHRKRVMALPFVLKRVRDTLPDARLRLVGFHRADVPDLARLFRELGLDAAVLWEGPVASEAIQPFYESAGVLVVPSAYEGLPLVILEAQRSGLPCVATRVSGHPEVIEDGRNGFLVDLDDPDQMAERCIEILRDEDLGHRMGVAGRAQVAGKFGRERYVDEYLDLYRRTIADGGR